MQPSEFWGLSPTEFWWELDSNIAKQAALKTGPKSFGGFSGAEWQAARKKHREKMNG